MSNEISDEAWYMAALKRLKRGKILRTGPNGNRAWVTFSCEDNDMEEISPEPSLEEALAAQAELDAAKNSYAGEPEEKPERRIYKQSAGRGAEEKMICSVYIDEKRIG